MGARTGGTGSRRGRGTGSRRGRGTGSRRGRGTGSRRGPVGDLAREPALAAGGEVRTVTRVAGSADRRDRGDRAADECVAPGGAPHLPGRTGAVTRICPIMSSRR